MSQASLLEAAGQVIYHEALEKWKSISEEDLQKMFEEVKNPVNYRETLDKWKGVPEEKLQKIFQEIKSASIEERFLGVRMPTLPSSTVTHLELDDRGVRCLHRQLVDSIQELSANSLVPQFQKDPEEFHSMFSASKLLALAKTSSSGRKYARLDIDRDNMVMSRLTGHRYPNGDSILTAYRKTLCAGQELLSEEEAARGFARLRAGLAGAKGAD